MIDRVLQDDRTRQAARRMRLVYRVTSALWVAAMAAFGAWMAVQALLTTP